MHAKNSDTFSGQIYVFLLIAIILQCKLLTSHAADGDIDTTFTTEKFYTPSGNAFSTALQSDGKILVAGIFDYFGNHATKGVARLNADGTIDSTFRADINGYVETIALQGNGNIYVGGSLEDANGDAIAGIVRLDSSGQIDSSFQTAGIGYTQAIIVLPNEKLLVIADYGFMESGLARLNVDGTFDSSFTFGRWGLPIALVRNEKIVVSDFNSQNLVRLEVDGTPDLSWSVVADAPIFKIMELENGKLFVGGSFRSIQSESAMGLAKLNEDGSFDNSFTREGSSDVISLALLDNGNILVGGSWATDTPVPDEEIFSELSPAGAYSIDFNNPEPFPYVNFFSSLPDSSGIFDIKLLPNGKIIVAGRFNYAGDESRNAIALLDDSTSVDSDFDGGLLEREGATIKGMEFAPNGKIFIIGDFTRVGSQVAFQIARLKANGSVDPAFDTSQVTNLGDGVRAVAVQQDGKVLVGGSFNSIQGQDQPGLARFLDNGFFDTTFRPDIDFANIEEIALTVQGDVIVGGRFSRIGAITRNNIAKFDSTGNLDLVFDPNVNRTVGEILLEKRSGSESGAMYIAGSFSTVGGYSVQKLAKLDQNGNLDLMFNPEINDTVRYVTQSPAAQVDLVVGGQFSQVNGESFAGIVGLNEAGNISESFQMRSNIDSYTGLVQDDGNIIAGIVAPAPFGRTEYSLEKIEADASSGDGFKISLDNVANAILLQSDGKLLVGGEFTTVEGEKIGQIFRIENSVDELIIDEEGICFPVVTTEYTSVICL